MQNRIDSLFNSKGRNVLSVFITAGFPKLKDTLKIVAALDKAEVDLIEIGIPFSDPLADGETIQQSSWQALQNGMTLVCLFEQLKGLRHITDKPVLLMGYLNSVIQFGIEQFYEKCFACGVDGVILPDLPINEFETEHKIFANKFNIHTVFLISPATSKVRIAYIDSVSKGFMYLVSSNSTTGQKAIGFEKINALLQEQTLKNPVLIGFGIKDAETFELASQKANGAIIGSEFIRRIKTSTDFVKDTKKFINEIKNKSYDYTVSE